MTDMASPMPRVSLSASGVLVWCAGVEALSLSLFYLFGMTQRARKDELTGVPQGP